MNVQSDKKRLRGQIGAEIEALPETYIAESDNGIFINMVSLGEFTGARKIMIYHSVGREPDTLRIANAALELGKTVAFPYCYRGGIMQAKVAKGLDELLPAMLGIPAPPETAPGISPEEIDLIIVPALTFARSGHRLGYGGGYYDRYLDGLSVTTAGLARQRLLADALPTEPHDIAVGLLITENGVLRI